MTETWRVALASGEVREVVVEYNGVQWRTFVDDYFGWGRAPQSAVAAVVGMHGWPVAEILAPGEPTRAEAIAAARREGAEAMREAILAALRQSLSGDQLRAIRAVEIDGGAR